jgi:DNA replication initiation complex subunit (GINS family)
MLDVKREMQGLYSIMTEEERKSYNEIVNSIGAAKEQVLI